MSVFMEHVKQTMLDLNDPNESMSNAWNEGYLVGRLHSGTITESEYDELMEWLKTVR